MLRQFCLASLGFVLVVSSAFSPITAQAKPLAKKNHATASASRDIQIWLTTADQKKLLSHEAGFNFSATNDHSSVHSERVIVVDANIRHQEMVGFGAAITDASAYLIENNLSPKQGNALISELFGPNEMNFSFTRLTIGASDFSQTHYSYNDMPVGLSDPNLEHFSLKAGNSFVLPVIKKALYYNHDLKVMASPWSAPAWMKTSDSLIQGSLKPSAYGSFAKYLVRYISEMKQVGVPIFAITLQNEPHFEPKDYPGMRVEPQSRADFIGGYLGPLFAKSGLKTRILDWDHNWDNPASPSQVLADPKAEAYISGIAWHCYAGNVSVQAPVAQAHPSKETYFTECSGGEWAPNWSDGFIWNVDNLIIGTVRGYAKGVILWNLALDENHGPHKGGCNDCRGVVTIDSKSGVITRNLEYYALGHASRFVRKGAVRIESTTGVDGINTVAFQNKDSSIVLIALNTKPELKNFNVSSGMRSFGYALPALSAATFMWKPQSVSKKVRHRHRARHAHK